MLHQHISHSSNVSVGPLSKGSMNVTVLKDDHGIIVVTRIHPFMLSRKKGGNDWLTLTEWNEEGRRRKSVGKFDFPLLGHSLLHPQRQGIKSRENKERKGRKKSFVFVSGLCPAQTLITMHQYYILPCKHKKKMGYVGKETQTNDSDSVHYCLEEGSTCSAKPR